MIRKTHLGLLALLCAVAVPALFTSSAFADACSVTLEDPSGHPWDIQDDGSVSSGEGAYDGAGSLYIDENETSNDSSYSNPDADGCTYEDDGREISFPTHENIGDLGVNVRRKVYVPGSGASFARWTDFVTNPNDTPRTVSVEWYTSYNSIERVVADEDGDGVVSVGERFAAFEQAEEARSSHVTHVASLWDGPDADGWDRPWEEDPSNIPGPSSDTADLMYDNITIPPGGTAVFIHFEHQNDTADGAREFAETYNEGSDELFAGMGDDEIAAARNWSLDPDTDGIRTYKGDNCDDVANADQADLDADGLGDACDDDLDGDGLLNAVEEGLGTNPRSADSDGDGVVDGLDQCGTRPGAERGCPAGGPPQTVVLPRLTPNRLTLTVKRSRPTRRSLRLRNSGRLILPAGLTAAEACTEGSVLVTVKAGGVPVSNRTAALRSDCTYARTVTFRYLRRLGSRPLVVQTRFIGNDRLESRLSSRVRAGRALAAA